MRCHRLPQHLQRPAKSLCHFWRLQRAQKVFLNADHMRQQQRRITTVFFDRHLHPGRWCRTTRDLGQQILTQIRPRFVAQDAHHPQQYCITAAHQIRDPGRRGQNGAVLVQCNRARQPLFGLRYLRQPGTQPPVKSARRHPALRCIRFKDGSYVVFATPA